MNHQASHPARGGVLSARRRPLLVVLALVTAPALAGAPRIEVQGHRGARGMRPENTLPAFTYAIETGVDTLEMDLAVTSDGVLVISHDWMINPDICLGPDGQRLKPGEPPTPIHSLTLAELKTYDCGTLKNPRFAEQVPVPGTRIPTLEEVFQMIEASPLPGAKTVQFNIETKVKPQLEGRVMPGPEVFAKLLVDLVHKHKLVSRVVVQSFDHRALVAVRKLEPKLRLSPLFGDVLVDITSWGKAFKPSILSPDLGWINAQAVKDAHAVGIRVIPWTADTPADWDWLLACGVDGIITDYPAQLIDYLKAKKLR